VEAAVLEVVLDAGSADPADSAVDDHDLAVIDVAERRQVPASRAVASKRPDRRTRLRRPDDADLDVGGIEPLIERSRILLGLRSLRSTTRRTGIPSVAFATRASAKASPTAPGRNPN